LLTGAMHGLATGRRETHWVETTNNSNSRQRRTSNTHWNYATATAKHPPSFRLDLMRRALEVSSCDTSSPLAVMRKLVKLGDAITGIESYCHQQTSGIFTSTNKQLNNKMWQTLANLGISYKRVKI
jgi:hypothetical protein